MSRRIAYGFGLGLCLLVASPALRDPADDSYPLSTYPMFARKREKPLFYFVEALDKRGGRSRLAPSLVGSGEVMQAASRVRRAVNAGAETTAQFCEEIASRVAASRDHRAVAKLAIIGARYDPIAYFMVGPEPAERIVQHPSGESMTNRDERLSGVQRVTRALDAFFYPPAPAARLSMLRILVGVFALAMLLIGSPNFVSVTRFRAAEFAPVGPVTLLTAPLPAPAVYVALALAVISGIAFVAGYRYRYSGPAFALLFLWVTSYRSSWGMKFHTENLVALHLLLLGVAPAAERSEGEHGRYGWAIRAMSVVTVTTYLIAGLAKLRLGGGEWLSGEALRVQVAYDNLRKIELGSVHSPVGAALVPWEGFFRVLGVSTLVLELGAPVALFGRRLSFSWVGAAFAFHLGVVALMAIAFPYPLSGVAYASFFEVERLRNSRLYRFLEARLGNSRATLPTLPAG